MKARLWLLGVLALLLLGVGVLRLVGIGSGSSEVETPPSEGLLGEPAPPFGDSPIVGDRVTLAEAQARLSWSIPLPSETLGESELVEAWVSPADWDVRDRQVYLIYGSGIEISIWGQSLAPDYAAALEPPFRLVNVRGTLGLGKEAGVQQIEGHGEHEYPASVTWWERGLVVNLYSFSYSLAELIAVAESMPRIEGPNQTSAAG